MHKFYPAAALSFTFLCSLSMATPDASKVLGPNTCASCHGPETKVWQATPHAKAFEVLHRLPRAKEIADKMGVVKIKSEGDCASCHFTVQKSGAATKSIAGVSCESCHGGAKDWVSLHHQKAKQGDAEAKGWLRHTNLYSLYEQCYQCHTVPNEKLVNQGTHAAGSAFELVSWSQGRIRHNFYDGNTNPEAPLPKKRVLYILGKALDLEYALRGVAQATVNDTFGQKMALRVKSAHDDLQAAAKLASIPEINEMTQAVPRKSDGVSLDIRLKQSKNYLDAADKVKAAAKNFAAKQDGASLAALDPLLPKEYVGTPAQ